MLKLEIEFLGGVCYAASERDFAVPEYPPEADRVFSALVASWGARGEEIAERAALEWLERQDPPHVVATEAFHRSSVPVFVPPNDDASGKIGSLRVMPAFRRRQERRFPAAVPHDPILHFYWNVEPDDTTFSDLTRVAGDVVYIGHSASLVRAHFSRLSSAGKDGRLTRRAPYAGRFAELERAFRRGERPRRGVVVPSSPQPGQMSPPSTMFGTQWIVMPGLDNEPDAPDARASAFVTKRLRDALMSAFGGAGQPVPPWISGHDSNGSPTREAHLAIVPMLDVGHRYASANLMGIALVPPRHVERADELLIAALLRLRSPEAGVVPHLRLFFGSASWGLAFTDDDERAALAPRTYLAGPAGARRWATVTPIVVDRHPKRRAAVDRITEIEESIAVSAQNIGLPAPVRVVADKHSAVTGAISAYPSNGAPPWTQWSLVPSIAGRPLTHAVLEFDEPVCGPVILGAGRFYGLGLCRPLNDERPRNA